VGHYNTFVVKIWCDDCGDMIRGHIQHVSSQEYGHFSSLNNMTDFVVGHLGHPPSNPVTHNQTTRWAITPNEKYWRHWSG